MNVNVNGTTLAYDDAGSGDPIVLLHAFPLSRAMWRDLQSALAPNYRVIAPDMRGLGASGQASSASTQEMADDVAALLDALDIEQAVLIGLSMGGYVALDFTRRYRRRVRGLILADTRATPDTIEGRESREALAQKVLREGSAAIAEQMLPDLLAASTHANKPEVVAQVRALIEQNTPAGIATASRGMAERTDSRPFVPMFEVPALVIVGADDALTPPKQAEALAAALPQGQLAIIPEAGHLANIENASAFNAAVHAFLAQL